MKGIPVNEPLLDGNEKKYLAECIDTGWISSEGPFIQRFETGFAARVSRRHGIAVCNGTAAIDAAIEALGIGPGDEVIMPAFTIISCITQIIRCRIGFAGLVVEPFIVAVHRAAQRGQVDERVEIGLR